MTDDFAPNFDVVETRWSLVRRAFSSATDSLEARNHLVLKYAGAVRGYIRALVRNDADADELSQDVIVRLIKGDFAGADPDRGRFRDFLKVSVKNMVRSHWSKQKTRDQKSAELSAESSGIDQVSPPGELASDETWITQWRTSLIEIAMTRLDDFQANNDGNVYYDAMRLRSSFPELDSAGLAAELSAMHGRIISPSTFRQHLKRARIKFAEFIVEEIADGIESCTPDQIQEELIDVGLYEYIKDSLPEKWRKA